MTPTATDPIAPQQPDSLAVTPTPTVDSAPATVGQSTPNSHPITTTSTITSTTHTISHNTVIPETLIRPHDTIFQPNIDTTEYLLLCNDSVFAQYDSLPTRQRQSMFATTKHHAENNRPILRQPTPASDWVFATIILLLTLISVYLNNQKFKLKDIILSLFDTHVLERVFRESNIRPISLMPMVGIYLATLAMIALRATQALDNIVIQMQPHLLFLAIFLAISAYFLLKNSFIRLLGNIFEDRSATMLYIANNNLFHFVATIVATPLTLLLFYFDTTHDTILKITLLLIAIIFIVRLIRGMQLILTNSKTSKMYLFYYLCILEIVPILVMAKIILI